MLRLLLAIVATVVVVVFVMVNTHHVSLSLVLGPPVKVRLIFLLMLTFIFGALVAVFGGMVARLRLRRRLRREGEAGRDRPPSDLLQEDA